MSRKLSWFRKFDGKWYVRVALATSKTQAKKQTRKLQSRGRMVRTVPIKHPITKRTGYAIYTKWSPTS